MEGTERVGTQGFLTETQISFVASTLQFFNIL